VGMREDRPRRSYPRGKQWLAEVLLAEPRDPRTRERPDRERSFRSRTACSVIGTLMATAGYGSRARPHSGVDRTGHAAALSLSRWLT
jgi:hypothetical protein